MIRGSALFVLLSALFCVAQQPAPANANEVHATIPLVLTKSLDAKKLKTGDEVVAKTAVGLQGNGVAIPSGTRVVGHVTQAQARSKGDPQSSLGIVFDKIELTNEKQVPIRGLLQAVAPSAAPTAGPGGGGIFDNKTGHGASSTAGSNPGGAQDNNADSSADQGLPEQKPLLNADSHGVSGIPHLELDKDSVLVSTDKDLKLDSGTQLLIRTFSAQSAQSR